MNTIFHITLAEQWTEAQNLGSYRSDTLATEGFIHCSTFSQVIGSANRFFTGLQNLVILVIDRDRVTADIRDEGVDSKNLFPHIYGKLNIDAVVKVIDLESDKDGLFVMPKELSN